MDTVKSVKELLSKHRYNKARVAFLENQIKKIVPETHDEYIEYRMFEGGYTGETPMFVMERGEEVSRLNKVEATSQEYRKNCEKEYGKALKETEEELKKLKYFTMIIEEALEVLDRLDMKYKAIIEGYYINTSRMEDIAQSIHISRSRCYDLRKEAIKCMARIIYGDKC